MAASNYEDVVRQLTAAGLILPRGGLEIGTARTVRCLVVDGGRERRGWYRLHELPSTAHPGDFIIVGSYGIWRGNEPNSQKIELSKKDPLTPDQAAALRKKLVEDRKRVERERAAAAAKAAGVAAKAWARLAPEGDSPYLKAKGVGAHGLKFTAHGSAVLPVVDTTGKIHGLQFLRTGAQAKEGRRPTKEFWPAGVAKKGHFHLIGHQPHWIVLVAEGYATAASLYEATGFPVAVAFDAGNLLPVAEALRRRYMKARILVCADDDCFTKGNPGITAASAAALAVTGAWLAPAFADEDARQAKHAANGHKLTDFNDLHALEGVAAVGAQVRARLSELRWDPPQLRAVSSSTAGEGDGRLRVIQHLDDLLERYALVYAAGGAVFDKSEHCLLPLTDMRNLCIRADLHKAWMEHPERDVVRQDEVGFDPAETDPKITCNLWGGWPTTPRKGKCDRLLELLHYMCSGEANSRDLYDWVLKWVAYPIQHPGAKLKSTIVVHGPQGTGKNLFFETVMAIYGKYGRILDQDALTDKHNDWASRKLFLIADEVVAQAHRFEVKNKLKTLITGTWIRINPKHIAAYDEANHVNLVFLSNESMPVVLEEDDRRHCIIWTPPKKPKEFYAELLREIETGGVEALHDHLLHLDLGDFNPGTLPPDTEAKRELIDLAQDSPVEFVDAVFRMDVKGTVLDGRVLAGLTQDWFDLYRHWCSLVGVKPASLKRFVNAIEKRRGLRAERKRYYVWNEVDIHPEKVGPHSVLTFGNEPPEGEDELAWLGKQVGQLRSRVADTKGSR
jgi:putative DNA primase/helicase